MKKLLLLSTLLSSQLFALIGFGGYGNFDLMKYPSGTDKSGSFSVVNSGFDNAQGGGFFVYLDLPKLPVVGKTALQFDFEGVANTYDFTTKTPAGNVEGSFPWIRASKYFTLRKTAMQVKIPFLAKAQLYYGGGFSSHASLPLVTVEFFEEAFGAATEAALEEAMGDADSDSQVDVLAQYMIDNINTKSGIHLTGGAQVKLLMANAFVNARYTIAKDVIPDKLGFLSVWAGLAIGF